MKRLGIGLGIGSAGSLSTGPPFVALTLDNYDVDENAADGSLVGNLVGGLGGDYVFYMATQERAGWFELDGGRVEVAAASGMDFETDASPTITVRELHTDDMGADPDNPVLPYRDTLLTLTVNDIDEIAPTITSANSANNAEGSTLAHALTANEAVTWTITGGVDQARFEISGSTLRWASNGVKDFETPNDDNTNNTYVVQVTATDTALNATNQTVTITVTNVLEVTLAALNLDDLTIAEDQPTGTKVGTITGASSGSTITLHAQSNADWFAKDGSDIEVGAAGVDFETEDQPTITLRETHVDASNSPRDSVITITVTDAAEFVERDFMLPNGVGVSTAGDREFMALNVGVSES